MAMFTLYIIVTYCGATRSIKRSFTRAIQVFELRQIALQLMGKRARHKFQAFYLGKPIGHSMILPKGVPKKGKIHKRHIDTISLRIR